MKRKENIWNLILFWLCFFPQPLSALESVILGMNSLKNKEFKNGDLYMAKAHPDFMQAYKKIPLLRHNSLKELGSYCNRQCITGFYAAYSLHWGPCFHQQPSNKDDEVAIIVTPLSIQKMLGKNDIQSFTNALQLKWSDNSNPLIWCFVLSNKYSSIWVQGITQKNSWGSQLKL